MHDRPNTIEVLETLAEWLEGELIPALSGGIEYRARVAANLTRILEREARLGPAQLARERELLGALVGTPSTPGLVADEVLELSGRLAKTLRQAAAEPDLEARAFTALYEIAKAKLLIARPGYDSAPLDEETSR